jgi:hypothetical protein
MRLGFFMLRKPGFLTTVTGKVGESIYLKKVIVIHAVKFIFTHEYMAIIPNMDKHGELISWRRVQFLMGQSFESLMCNGQD